MFNLFGPNPSVSDSDSASDSSKGEGSFFVEVEVIPPEAPPLEKDEDGRYDLPIARAVVKGGTSTLAGLVLALLLSIC
jgi:hypothetical protein